MKYYLIAGEASGDLHGSNLIKALKNEDKQADFRCWGGDLMQAAGGTVVKHIRELAFMGFVEVVKNLPTIFSNLRFCKLDILDYQSDVLILIDYPGFNLRMAKWAKAHNIKVFYYISPQIWAWKESRVHTIKRVVDKMFVILPFECAFYQKYDYEVDFVGHPLLDVIPYFEANTDFFFKNNLPSDKPLVALLPGSRMQEVKKNIETMGKMASQLTQYHFVIALAGSLDKNDFLKYATFYPNLYLVHNQTYQLLHHAQAALVTSGTATLETALFNVPQIVCYKGNAISYQIAKRLIKIKYISLVNLIADKPIVTELIQDDFNLKNLSTELIQLFEPNNRQRILNDYAALRKQLGNTGASARAATLIKKYLSEATEKLFYNE